MISYYENLLNRGADITLAAGDGNIQVEMDSHLPGDLNVKKNNRTIFIIEDKGEGGAISDGVPILPGDTKTLEAFFARVTLSAVGTATPGFTFNGKPVLNK